MGWRHFPLPIFSCRHDVGGVNATDNIPRRILDAHRTGYGAMTFTATRGLSIRISRICEKSWNWITSKQSEGWGIALITKLKNSLTTKIFLVTCLLLTAVCALTYGTRCQYNVQYNPRFHCWAEYPRSTNGLAKLSELDFSWRCKEQRTDEIGTLAHNLDELAAHLSRSMQELQAANDALQKDVTVFGGILKRKLGSNTMYDIILVFIVGLNVLA